MKKNSLIKIVIAGFAGVILNGCLDGNMINTPPGAASSFIMLTYNTGEGSANINSGLSPAYFSNQALSFPLTDAEDTSLFAVTIQGPGLHDDLHVTLGIDNSKLADNYAADSLVYEPMPDSTYSLNRTGVVTAGTTYAQFQLIVYPSKIDGLRNFMLPIIVSSNDASLSSASNYGTLYIHTVGNPLIGIGPLTHEWLRWNNDTGTGPPDFDENLDPALFSPVNSNTASVASNTGVIYLLSFSYNKGTYSNWNVAFDAQSVTDAGITITSGPTITKADAVTGDFEFTFGYNNSSGAARVIIDKFIK